RGEHASVAARIEAVTRRRRLARELADALEVRLVRDAAAQAAQDDLNARVAASDFSHPDEATASLRDAAAREALTSTIRRHDVSLATERDRLRDLELELAGAPEQLIDVEIVGASVAAARAVWRDAAAAAARAAEAATRLDQLARRIAAAHAETATLSAAYNLVSGLADAIAGRTASRMDLETFVLAAELEEIVSAANLRLDEMSSGRYRLQHSDAVAVRNGASGLGLEVLDAYTGRTRPPQSLSGGETFLASLALALGLAEVVTARAGGIRLDTLFVDEGFGSLDAETLDLAMRTLDELRQGGRTVGVISHVEAMKEQLPAQLRVEATPSGPSVIRQGMLAPVEAVGTPA
ncbi:MAG: SbcC/MukB-like Walker B domain-containing protein, partial [Microbacterium pygmaeum]